MELQLDVYKLSGSLDYPSVEYDGRLRAFEDAHAGRALPRPNSPFHLRSIVGSAKKGVPLGDCPYFAPSLLLASPSLRQVLSDIAGRDVDFCPVIIDDMHEYWYVHVACELDALDLDRSMYKRFPDGAIKYVAMARFREDVIDAHTIFTLANYSGVYATAAFKRHIESSEVQGVEFEDTSERVDNPFAQLFGKR